MENLFLILFTVVITPIMYIIYKSMKRPENFPPGPLGIPIIGSAQYLKQYPYLDMLELAKKYGNVFSLKTFGRNIVCVCGYEANKEVLNKRGTNGRSVLYIFNIVKGKNSPGVIHEQLGKSLTASRSLLHAVVTNASFEPKKYIENTINFELTQMIRRLEKIFKKGEAQIITNILEVVPISVLVSVIFGLDENKSENEKARILKLKENIFILESFITDKLFRLPGLIPSLDKIWLPESAKNFISTSKEIFDFIEAKLDLHSDASPGESPKDLVDCYRAKMRENDSSEVFTERNLVAMLYDVVIAGSSNTAKLSEFAALYLAGHQDIQNKVYEEIVKVVGDKNDIDYDVRKEMPYTNATMHEVLRFANVTPNAVPRQATEDTIISGYAIPKGTTFLLNSYSVHMQGDQWKNAKKFDPENFLDEEGNFFVPDAFMPFGGGLRICSGNPLVKQYLFTYLIKMLQNFSIKPQTDDTKLDYKPQPVIVPKPVPQKLRLIPRK